MASKPLSFIFALGFCAVLTTAFVVSTAHAANNDKESIKLPAFHKQTVKINGKDVTIEVRWFDKPFTVSSTDVDTLPASATRAWIAAYQDLIHEKYDGYVSRFVDTQEAQKYVDQIQDASKGHDAELKEYEDLLRGVKITGEVRDGSCELAVTVFHDKKTRVIQPVFVVRTDGKYRLVAAPFRRNDTSRLMNVGSLIQKGKIAPPADKNENNQD